MIVEKFDIRNKNILCPTHINPELEVVFVKKGTVAVNFADSKQEVKQGEAILIFPFQLHGFIPSEQANVEVYMFPFIFVEDFYKSYQTKIFKKRIFEINDLQAQYIKYCLKNKNEENTVKSLCYMFFASFLRDNDIVNNGEFKSENIEPVIRYIYDNIEDKLTLESVAVALNINRTKLCGIFRNNIKISFNVFLQNLRLEKAKTLLINSSKTVTEISFECGFGSVRTFNRLFIQYTGLTPSQFAKSNN